MAALPFRWAISPTGRCHLLRPCHADVPHQRAGPGNYSALHRHFPHYLYSATWDTTGGGGVPAYGRQPDPNFYAGFKVTKGLRFSCDNAAFVGNKMDVYVNDIYLQTIVMPSVG